MTDHITVPREQAEQIFPTPETAPIMYAIVGNLTVIQTNLIGLTRVNRN
jgi:hypothetical protein